MVIAETDLKPLLMKSEYANEQLKSRASLHPRHERRGFADKMDKILGLIKQLGYPLKAGQFKVLQSIGTCKRFDRSYKPRPA